MASEPSDRERQPEDKIHANPVLPYSLYLEQGGRKLRIFARGEPFPEDKALRSEAFPASEKMTILQGLKDHEESPVTLPYCQFDAGLGEGKRSVIFEVNREYQLTAELHWKEGEEMKARSLDPVAIPPAPK